MIDVEHDQDVSSECSQSQSFSIRQDYTRDDSIIQSSISDLEESDGCGKDELVTPIPRKKAEKAKWSAEEVKYKIECHNA